MYCSAVFESDHINTLLIFTVTESNIATFILVANTAACSSKRGTVKVFLLIGASLDLPQMNEHFLPSLSLNQK